MDKSRLIEELERLAEELDKYSDDVPYELSARNNLYFRMVEAAGVARELLKDIKEKYSAENM